MTSSGITTASAISSILIGVLLLRGGATVDAFTLPFAPSGTRTVGAGSSMLPRVAKQGSLQTPRRRPGSNSRSSRGMPSNSLIAL
eukprot:5297133-Alexandrium_andersonii.AAC.1